MVINLTELPLMNWSDAQILAAKELASDGMIREYELPTIKPEDRYTLVWTKAWETWDDIFNKFDNIDAVIIQGEPAFVCNFVEACKSELPPVKCYSPCYDNNGNFVQFRRF